MATIPTAALVRRGMELISNLVAMIDSRASLSLRSDMAEFIAQMISILDSAKHNNAAVDAVAQQLRGRLSVINKLSLYPPAGPQLNRISLKEFQNLSELAANQIPLSTIIDLCEMRSNLTTLIVTNSGIVDIADVLTSHAPRKLRSKLPPIILQEKKVAIPMKYCWTNLTKLSLSNCGIVRMDEAFHFFPFLTHLDLSNNDITHVVHLHDCVSLESLNLSYNRIRVLSNLERVIGRVKKINLAHNDIESLDGLDKIYALEKVNLSFNYIDDMIEVQHLCRLPNLEAVYLADNPISELANYRLRFYREFIVHGSIMNGNRPFPSLDRVDISKRERKKLRKLMFRAPVDAMRESSYHDTPDEYLADDYYYDDDDGGLTVIEEETGENEDDFDLNRDTFYHPTGRESLLGRSAQGGGGEGGDVAGRYSMRFSVDRTASTGNLQFAPGTSPNKMRQSSVIAPNFFRTVSMIRNSTNNAGSLLSSAQGQGFMAKRKYTKRMKRVAVISDGDEPEVYPKLQEVLAQIAVKKEQELQLQRAKEVMEKALRAIHSQQQTQDNETESFPSPESKRNRPSTDDASRSLSGSPTPPNRLSLLHAHVHSENRKSSDFPNSGSGSNAGDAMGDTTNLAAPVSTNRRSLRAESSTGSNLTNLLSSSVPDAILFPRDLDLKLRGTEQHQAFSPTLPRSLSREFRDSQGTFNNNRSNSQGGRTSSSSSGHDDSNALLLASMDPYIGDPQYKSLNILDNLELYFREQVFNPKRPSYPQIYLHEDLGRKEKLPAGLQHAMCLIAAYHPDERLVTMFCEKVIDVTALENRRATSAGVGGESGTAVTGAGTPVPTGLLSATGDDDDDDDVGAAQANLRAVSPEKPMALILSDHALYFINMDEISTSATFSDAPVFTVTAHYPLYQLSVCTIYFGFQRCALTFAHPSSASQKPGSSSSAQAVSALTTALSNSPVTSAPPSAPNSPTRPRDQTMFHAATAATSATTSSSTANTLIAKYMIISREKSRTYPVITRVPQVANQIRNHHQPNPLTNVKIENKDSQLIEQVMRYIQGQGDHDVVYYQMCFQTRSKAPSVFLPRSLILTQSLILLCYEDLISSEVQLTVLECWKLKDIHKIAVDESKNMQLILTFAKRTNVIGNRKKWRITTDSRNASNKMLEELRRACNDLGNAV